MATRPALRLRLALVGLLGLCAGPATAKQARAPHPSLVHSADDPRYRSRPGEALSCPSPCRAGLLEAASPWFEAVVSCDDGSFTLRTGTAHPATLAAGAKQDILFGGVLGDTTGGEVRFHVYTTGSDYPNPAGGGACAFDPADTPAELANLGIEREVTVQADPGLSLLLREEVVIFGDSADSAGIRLTLAATNLAASTRAAAVGLRFWLDPMSAGDDGPLWAPVACTPLTIGAERNSEHDFAPAEIPEFFRFRNNTGTPEVAWFGTSAPVARFPDTRSPDRLILGRWSNLLSAPWDAVASELDAIDSDSVLLFYSGYPDTAGLPLPVGDSVSRSLVILADCDQTASTCVPVDPTGQVGNSLRGARAGADADLSWTASTLAPPDARLFRTASKAELAETQVGIGDEAVIATTATRSARDTPPPDPVSYYAVLPVDSCGSTVFP